VRTPGDHSGRWAAGRLDIVVDVRAVLLTLAAVAVGALAACGDEDQTSAAGGEPTITTTEESTVSTTTITGTGLPKERCEGAESPPNIVDVISHGADCGAVEAAMADLESVSKEFRIGDFQCARTSGGPLGGSWECRGEASYFTFEFGD
jgi:hypothetical protein